jgi:hypothetical protein
VTRDRRHRKDDELYAADEDVHPERWGCIKYDLAAVCAAVVGIAYRAKNS